MAVDPHPQFEHKALEADMERLATEIREHHPTAAEQGRGAVKEVLHKHIYAGSTPIDPQQTSNKTQAHVLPNYLQDSPAEVKFRVEKLIDLAYHKGVFAAIKEARKGEPLILDAFHDALTDKLYDELQTHGHIKGDV